MFAFLASRWGLPFADATPAQEPPVAQAEPEPQAPWMAWLEAMREQAAPQTAPIEDAAAYAQHWADTAEHAESFTEKLTGLRGGMDEADTPLLHYGPHVTVDPTSGKATAKRVKKSGDQSVTSKLELGNSSVGGGVSASRTDAEGVKEGASAGASYDWKKGQVGLKGGLSRESKTGDGAGDYSLNGGLKLTGDDVAMSGGYTTGKGANKRGASFDLDTAKGSFGVGLTRGNMTYGASLSRNSVAAQVGNGKRGGGFSVRSDGDGVDLGANVALSEMLSGHAQMHFSDDEVYMNVGGEYAGVGGSLEYGWTKDKLRRQEDDGGRAASTVEDGSIHGIGVSAFVADAGLRKVSRELSTASAALPADFDGWSPERQAAWRAELDAEARRVRRARDLDLDAMREGGAHRFDESEEVSGNLGLDVKFLPGSNVEGHVAGTRSEGSSLEVARAGDETWEVNESRRTASSLDLGASGKVAWGVASARVQRTSEEEDIDELSYRLGSDVAKEGFEKHRLGAGLLPGAEGHAGYAEAMRLAQVANRTPFEDERLAELRAGINREIRGQAQVGAELADDVLVTDTRKTEYDGLDVSAGGSFLGFSTSYKKGSTSRKITREHLDDDGSVDHTEDETRSQHRGDHADEAIQAVTTDDADGPALSFASHQIVQGADHIAEAMSAGSADVLPGESSFKSERLVDTTVTLSRAQASRIAEMCNAPESDHWSKMAAKIATLRQDQPLVALMTGATADVTSPEDFARLSPLEQASWLRIAQKAATHEGGNVFDSVAAIELIADPKRKREAYAELMLANHDDKGLANQDLGAEYLEFASSLKARSEGALDLAADAATSTGGDAGYLPKGPMTAILAGTILKTVGEVFPQTVGPTLIAAYQTGGPAQVTEALAGTEVEPLDVYETYAKDPRQLQALLEATDGTAFGSRLQQVMRSASLMGGPEALTNPYARLALGAITAQAGAVNAATPPRNADERRGRSLARNLHIPGTGEIVAATLLEAQRDGGEAALQAALESAGGLSVEQVVERLRESGDDASALHLRMGLLRG